MATATGIVRPDAWLKRRANGGPPLNSNVWQRETMHIHVTGASGSGCTTLGAALAGKLGLLHLDADTYYWLPTSPPFQAKRPVAERFAALKKDLDSSTGAVLSGSIVGWGAEIEDAFDLIVFLYLPAPVRIERLRRRELEKFGWVDESFLEWAGLYDQGPPEGRSLAKHKAWLVLRQCPVLCLDADESVDARLQHVRVALLARFGEEFSAYQCRVRRWV